ncbi:MAG: energy transducer TonB [Kangiellaceae bacterium]|nr:energy transducer TonB [Kangiellaceae bacterium]
MYSKEAILNNIKGYIKFSFAIAENGTPLNIQVVDSHPIGIFEQEALKALSKWHFKPKIINGRPIVQQNMYYRIDFILE